MMDKSTSITIIGLGAVGSALLKFFVESGFVIRSVWDSRSGKILKDSKSDPVIKNHSFPQTENETGELVFITTPDDEISKVAEKLALQSINWERKVGDSLFRKPNIRRTGIIKKSGRSNGIHASHSNF